MKDAKLKSMFMMVLMSLILAFTVYGLTVIQTYPSEEWDISSDNSIDFSFTPEMEVNIVPWCTIYTNQSGTFQVAANFTDLVNGTPKVIGIAINDSNSRSNLEYGWNVTCTNSTSGIDQEASAVIGFGVDGNTPSVTLDSPANNYYSPDLIFFLQYTPTDTSNTEMVDIYTNISDTWEINLTNATFDSGIQYEMSSDGAVEGGVYIWNVFVNDTANNSAWGSLGGNRTFIIDTQAPPVFNITAVTGERQDSLRVNKTATDDSTPLIVWNKSEDNNFQKYDIILSATDTFETVIQTTEITDVDNNQTNLSNIETDGAYYVKVIATDLAGNTRNTSPINFTLDRVAPVVTLITPLNASFIPAEDGQITTLDVNVTVTDANPNVCDLFVGESGRGFILNSTEIAISTGVEFNLTISTNLSDGVYQLKVECNDTVGIRVNASENNISITIDSTSPTFPNITSSWHQRNNTDKTPDLSWNTVTETNFEKYTANAYYLSNSSLAFTTDVTTRTVNFTQMVLNPNFNYNFSVVAYDLAGNSRASANSSDETAYYVDPICGTLTAGWNLCGAVWTTGRNLSTIGAETNANFVSVWNSTHQWATCNYAASPSGQHCNVQVNISSVLTGNQSDTDDGRTDRGINHAVWVYVNESREWRNRTWTANQLSSNITLFNTSNGWNLEAGFFRNGRTFGHLGAVNQYDKNNVSMMSLRYNNGTSVPYVNQDFFAGINNLTNIEFGYGYWIFFNATGPDSGLDHNNTWNVGGW